MSQYVYQRTGGPLTYWTPGTVPRQSRAADARSMGQEPPAPGANFGAMGCGGGGCGCNDCGGGGVKGGMGDDSVMAYGRRGMARTTAMREPPGAAHRYPSQMGMGGGYPEYGGQIRGRVQAIAVPRGAAQRYVSSLGTVPFIPGAPEPLTGGVTPGDVTGLIDPYPATTGSSFPWGTVILGGLALAVALPYLKKMGKKK